MTLSEDFDIWWNLSKYKDIEIPAREYSTVGIVTRHGSNAGWPGDETDVKYWVELENGYAVGVITPRKAPATFPVYLLPKTNWR